VVKPLVCFEVLKIPSFFCFSGDPEHCAEDERSRLVSAALLQREVVASVQRAPFARIV
jgi:hypothetical protein